MKTLNAAAENKAFMEILQNHNFELMPQADQSFCHGCNVLHERHTKIYSNGKQQFCRFSLIRHFDPELTA